MKQSIVCALLVFFGSLIVSRGVSNPGDGDDWWTSGSQVFDTDLSLDTMGFLEIDNRVFREDMPIAGTPFKLHYTSWRVPGNQQAYRLYVPLFSEGSVAPGLDSPGAKRVDVHITVTNRSFDYAVTSLNASSNVYFFLWDGRDSASNLLSGAHPASIEVSTLYVEYSMEEQGAGALTMSSSASGSGGGGQDPASPEVPLGSGPPGYLLGGDVQGSPKPDVRGGGGGAGAGGGGSSSSAEVGGVGESAQLPVPHYYTVTRSERATLGTMLASIYGLGGWTLTPHHYYDAKAKMLYMGNGWNRLADPIQTPACVFTNGASLGTNDISIVSENGRTLYVFNSQGRHLRSIDTIFNTTNLTFTYDTNGFLSTIADVDGDQTTIERNGLGQATAIVGPFGQRTSIQLDGNSYLAALVNPAFETNRFQYATNGLLTNVVTRRGYEFSISYDSTGLVVQAGEPTGASHALAKAYSFNGYDIAYVSPGQRTNSYYARAQEGSYKYRRYTSPSLATTETWHAYDRTISTTKHANGVIDAMMKTGDPRFGLQSPYTRTTTRALPSGLTRTVTQTVTATISDTNNLLTLISLTNHIDRNGNIYTLIYIASNRTLTAISPEGRVSVKRFTQQGRLECIEYPGLMPITITYDELGRVRGVSQGSGGVSSTKGFGFATNGFMQFVTNAILQTKTFSRDQIGRVTNVALTDGNQLALRYDDSSNLIGLTPPGREEHTLAYSSVSLLEQYTAPSIGGESNQLITWNSARQATSLRLTDGSVTSNRYTDGGLLAMRSWQDDAVTNEYLCGGLNVSSITSTSGASLKFMWDGYLLTNASISGPISGSVSYTYNQDLRCAGIALNGSNICQYGYDLDGLLTNAGLLEIKRSAASGITTGTLLNAIADSRSRNGFGMLTNYSADYWGTNVLSYSRDYDLLGRLTSRVERRSSVTNRYDYSYDSAGRLSQVLTNGSICSVYQYDANGNRTSSAIEGATCNAVYDGQDRMLTNGAGRYQYDHPGRLTNRYVAGMTTSYRYDGRGSLRAVTLPGGTNIEYAVDGLRRRVAKRVNGTLVWGLIYRNGFNAIAEVDGSTNVISIFIYGTRKYVPDYMVRSGTIYRLLSDQLGSIRVVVNAGNGQVVQEMDYDEFGRVLQDTSPGFQPFGFAGGLYDPDTGLVHFGFREYDASVGRWTTKDPALFSGSTMNLYAYCSSDPINSVDPLGLSEASASEQIEPVDPDDDGELDLDFVWDSSSAPDGIGPQVVDDLDMPPEDSNNPDKYEDHSDPFDVFPQYQDPTIVIDIGGLSNPALGFGYVLPF